MMSCYVRERRMHITLFDYPQSPITHTHAINVTFIIYDFIFHEGSITLGYHLTASGLI